MRALWLRFYRFAGWRGLYTIALGLTVGPVLLIVGGIHWILVSAIPMGLTIAAATVAIVAFRKYQRTASVKSSEEVLPGLLSSATRFCLLLRRFGDDAQIIVPSSAARSGFTRNTTMEQIIAAAASTALGMPTYGIVDPKIALAPPAVNWLRAADNEWQAVARDLIGHAHSIVLTLTAGLIVGEGDRGKGFAWEIEQIVAAGAQSRVIIVLPPHDQDGLAHRSALHQACLVMALLKGSGKLSEADDFTVHEYELDAPELTLLVRFRDSPRPEWWEVNQTPPTGTVIGDQTYLHPLTIALRELDHDSRH